MPKLIALVVGAAVAAALIQLVRRYLLAWELVYEHQQALLYQNGRYLRTLGPGRHMLIKLFLNQAITAVDARLVSVAVPGQEILTKDKIPLRLTLIAQYRVADPAAAVHKTQNYASLLYEELQLAMRAIVAAETLEDLLTKREPLSRTLAETVAPRVAKFGVELAACGLKDVILPGEIKSLLTKAAEAQRAAEAGLITAREELAATRAQLNTAKLIEEHPAILRLKELQAILELAKKPGNTVILTAPTELAARLSNGGRPKEG